MALTKRAMEICEQILDKACTRVWEYEPSKPNEVGQRLDGMAQAYHYWIEDTYFATCTVCLSTIRPDGCLCDIDF